MAILFKHSCNTGDLIASLAGIKEVCGTLNEKAIIYQELNVAAQYYDGATHPVTASDGNMVCMNKPMFDMVSPLIKSQPYIEDFREYNGEKITVDFDRIRDRLDGGARAFSNIPFGMIQSWVIFAYPDMATDLSKPWLSIGEPDPITSGKVILNFTERYRSTMADYSFLKKYESHLLFTGTKKECAIFCETWGLSVPYLEVDNFLELAKCIKGAKFLMGNQSANWNIANAMGTPRVLEMCPFAPNCQPFVGENNFGHFNTKGIMYYFERLFNNS